MMRRIGDWRLEEEFNRDDEPVAVLFKASGMRRGQELRREVRALARDHFLPRSFEADLTENPGLEARFEIQHIPILIVFEGGGAPEACGRGPAGGGLPGAGARAQAEPDTPAGIDDPCVSLRVIPWDPRLSDECMPHVLPIG